MTRKICMLLYFYGNHYILTYKYKNSTNILLKSKKYVQYQNFLTTLGNSSWNRLCKMGKFPNGKGIICSFNKYGLKKTLLTGQKAYTYVWIELHQHPHNIPPETLLVSIVPHYISRRQPFNRITLPHGYSTGPRKQWHPHYKITRLICTY